VATYRQHVIAPLLPACQCVCMPSRYAAPKLLHKVLRNGSHRRTDVVNRHSDAARRLADGGALLQRVVDALDAVVLRSTKSLSS